jgi:uncharacterized membrane protein HdeD (DUF308 family)
MTRKIATALIALGIFGLVTGFRVLVREQWGAGIYSAGGVILLAVGVLLYVLNSKKASNKSTSAKREPTFGDET